MAQTDEVRIQERMEKAMKMADAARPRDSHPSDGQRIAVAILAVKIFDALTAQGL